MAIGEQAGCFRLEAVARGEEIAAERHRLVVDVKAVTLHRFAVGGKGGKYPATVVLDV